MQNDFNDNLSIAAVGTSYSEAYRIDPNCNVVDLALLVSAITGTSPTLDVTVQVSLDGVNWTDRLTFRQVTAAMSAPAMLRLLDPQNYVRFKQVAGGTNPVITGSLFAQARQVTDLGAEPTDTLVGRFSGGDFNTSYVDSDTINLSTYPDGSQATQDDILKVIQYASTGAVVAEYVRGEAVFSMSGNELTVKGANFTTNDTFVVITNVVRSRATTTPTSTTTGMDNTIPMAQYNSTPTVRTNGQLGPLEADENGNVKVTIATRMSGEDQDNDVQAVVDRPLSASTYAMDSDTSTASEASSVIKAAPGNLYEIDAANTSAGALFLHVFNRTSVPANGTVPRISIPVAAGAAISRSWRRGKYFDTGMCWAWSSTQGTLTLAAASGIADVDYK